MEIRIIKSIDDPFLKSEWERLEKESDIFPQSSYHWCSTWWKFLSGKRKLHVVTALDDENKTAAIAPMCIERHFGIPVLRTFPIHFGDFYTFITSNAHSSPEGVIAILEYLASNRQWRWVRVDRVSETSFLAGKLNDYNYREKPMAGCVIADISGLDWESYLSSLKKSFRSDLLRRLKIMHKAFKPELICVRTWKEYEGKFDEMVEIHRNRWMDDNSPAKGTIELACWKEAIRGQFEDGKMIYYQLLFDSICVAYDLGFLHKGTYYDWHTSFRPDYRSYSPGIMLQALMIKHFIENGVSRINFMSGDYYYKLHWTADQRLEGNYMFSSTPNNIAAFFLNWYYYNFRDNLRAFYRRAMQYSKLRAFSKITIFIRQKLTGLR